MSAGEMPAKLTWGNQVVGETQRGRGKQQVVLPGSVHPSGGTYRWITEDFGSLCIPIHPVTDPLPTLPGLWLAYVRAENETYAD